MARQGSELYQLKGSGAGPCFLPQGEKLCTAAFKVPFNKFLVLKAKRVSECSFSVSYQWTTSLFCTKWQNVCVNIDQDGRQLSHFHLLGVRLLQVSSCLGVHLDWVPYGTWKKWLYSAVNHLQDLSIIRVPVLWDDLSASLSVPLSAVSVVFTAPVPAQKVPSVVLTKIGCICLVWRRAGMKREKRWKDSEKTRGGKRVGDERVIWAKGRWRRYVYVEDSVAANYLASLIKCKLLTELRGCWCWR